MPARARVHAGDDDTARQFELRADSVWRDAMAVGGEHDPDHASPTQEAEA